MIPRSRRRYACSRNHACTRSIGPDGLMVSGALIAWTRARLCSRMGSSCIISPASGSVAYKLHPAMLTPTWPTLARTAQHPTQACIDCLRGVGPKTAAVVLRPVRLCWTSASLASVSRSSGCARGSRASITLRTGKCLSLPQALVLPMQMFDLLHQILIRLRLRTALLATEPS